MVSESSKYLAMSSMDSNISADIRRRTEFVFAGGMPADGCVTLTSGWFSDDLQAEVAALPEVTASAFTVLAEALLPSGSGQIQGVDFTDSFFEFALSAGRLPLVPREAVVDYSLGGIAGYEVGSAITLRKPQGQTYELRLVGILGRVGQRPVGRAHRPVV